MILELVAAVGSIAEGDVVSVPLSAAADADVAAAWCARSGNTLVSTGPAEIVVRRGRVTRPLDALPPDRRPGARLWLYTNFDCNLRCDYCCVRSSPQAPRRELGLERVRRLAAEAADAGVGEIYLTGGEPLLLPDIGEIVAACVAVRPTTLLTNGMLFRGRRLAALLAMPRQGFALQVSLDSATSARHDQHRGSGAWARALAGIRTAVSAGFRVRVAATVDLDDAAEERALRDLLTREGIGAADQVVRPVARRGFAERGVAVTVESVVPEVTVTADGVFWHPVGADDADQLVTREIFPLAAAIERVRSRFEHQREQAQRAARLFPCA